MLELLGTATSAILGGGATGLLGVLVQRWFDHKNKQADLEVLKAQHAHEETMRDKDSAIMAQEWAGRTRVAETEAAGREAEADAKAFGESFASERPLEFAPIKATKAQSWFLVVVDSFRRLIRPGLTVYLCAITTKIYLMAVELLDKHGSTMTAAEALDLTKMVVGTVLYLTTTCVLWWFGTRNKQQPPAAYR
jgi:hypothetical protein